jgi:sensor histidine kinase YesM
LYAKALAGGRIRLEHFLDSLNRFFEYSLHPIQAAGKITGVAIYARDITDRIQKELTIKENALELVVANKKMGELKLMALRSAMNPHFIFNSLNSIQYFVARNDRQNALNYLSYFSKLIRGILRTSIQNRIRLAEELNLLRYYISLELLRFEDKFEVQYHLAPGLDPDSIEVPSLLIQPFVENAILHGLYNRESRGLLQIRVFTQGHNLVVEVEDNGVGRAAAGRIRQTSMQAHQSVGIHITQERLAIINQEHTISVEMVDLYQDQEAAGTLVKIVVRLDE